MIRTILLLAASAVAAIFSGCRSAESTASIPAVRPFDAERYLGTWGMRSPGCRTPSSAT